MDKSGRESMAGTPSEDLAGRWRAGSNVYTIQAPECMGYPGYYVGWVGPKREYFRTIYFRTINVQWIEQWALFSPCGTSLNQ
jgi:hypothetical protein